MSVKKNLHEGNILYFGSCLGRAKPRSLIHLSTCFWHPSCQALNLEITKGQGTGKICSLQRGFVISRYFFIYFAGYYCGKENCSLYPGLRIIEVQVPTFTNCNQEGN